MLSVLTSTSDTAKSKFVMVRDVEVIPLARPLAESLCAVESHVLDHHDCSVHDQDHVKLGVGDNGSLVLFDDSGQHGQARGRAVISIEHAVGAFFPFPNWRVDRLLNVLRGSQIS